MNDINPGWEDRLAQYQPSDIQVEIWFPSIDDLPEHEQDRLVEKFRVLEPAVQKLAFNMLKGTIKYHTDNRTKEEWLEFQDDETADLFNYMVLRKVAGR